LIILSISHVIWFMGGDFVPDEKVSSPLDVELERRGYEIAKRLFSRMSIPFEEEEEEEEEEEGVSLTMTNLRNMLEAARDAKRKGSWDIFKLKVIYLARKARGEDPLYRFVRELLTALTEEPDPERRIMLAEKTLIASIYMFNALRKGFCKIALGR